MLAKNLNNIHLSDESVHDLERILKDPRVLNLLVIDNKHISQITKVCNNGIVYFKRHQNWLLNWWFREENVVKFYDLCVNLIMSLSGDSTGNISEEVYKNRIQSVWNDWFSLIIEKQDYNEAVRILMYCYLFGFRNPPELREYKQKHAAYQPQQKNNNNRRNFDGVAERTVIVEEINLPPAGDTRTCDDVFFCAADGFGVRCLIDKRGNFIGTIPCNFKK